MLEIEDQILLKLIGKGNTNAFSTLFLRYYPKLKRFILSLLQDEMCAEDLSQDIFLNLWTKRSELQQIENFDGYLYKTARNAVYQYLRRALLQQKFDMHVLQLNSIEENFVHPAADELLHANELEQLLTATVDKMPPQRKKIFKMSRHEGKSNQEISELLGISKRTVENHLTQALAELRKIRIILTIFI